MKRNVLFGLLALGFIWAVIARFTELRTLEQTLRQGKLIWVTVAAGLQGVYYLIFAASYQSAFQAVGIKSRLRDLLPVTLSSLFVNVVAPSGGASGAALFVDDAHRRGAAPAQAATAVLLQLLSDFSAFLILLLFSLVYLSSQGLLQSYEMLGAGVLLAVVIALALSLRQPTYAIRLLSWVEHTLQKWSQKTGWQIKITEGWGERNGQELASAARVLNDHPQGVLRTVAVAFLAQLVDLASLAMLFLAFYRPVSLAVLLAGFAMGILFWIVSITPQGIGVVEGVMTLVFVSLGIPANIAAAVSLSFRGLTFWLPMILGFILLRRVQAFRPQNQVLLESVQVRLLAFLTALMGLINLVSSVTPSLADRVRRIANFSPLEVRSSSHLAATLAGFALLLLAEGLWRRKRSAWMITVAVLIFSVATHLLKGLDYEEAALAGTLAVWLLLQRSHFTARSDPPSVQSGLRVFIAALGFTLLYGVTGFYLLDHHFQVNFSLAAALRQTLIMFTQFYDPGLQPLTGFGRFFAGSIYAVGAATVGYSLIQLIRPVLVRRPPSEQEKQRAQTIVEKYGRSSLARLALLDDKLYFFSNWGTVIPYVVKGRTALVLGDPIGPDYDFIAALRQFKSFCDFNDWLPAFYQVLPDHLAFYRSEGFESVCIGQEAIVELGSFSLEGRANKDLRTSMNRMNRNGYFARLYPPPVPKNILAQLRLVSDEWLGLVQGSEKKFSLGWFDVDYLSSCPIMVVASQADEIMAFANLIPEYQLNEISIDLMRYRRNAEPGTMDFLFVSMIQWAKAAGYSSFNLGLSALSGIGEQPQDPAVEKALHFTYEHIDRFYNFKGLHHFKEKYHPRWSPRYLIYPRLTALPSISIALARANSGDELLAYFKY